MPATPTRRAPDAVAHGTTTDRGAAVPRPAWAALLVALSPLSLVVLAYGAAQWVSAPIAAHPSREGTPNRLGFPLHVGGPAAADRRMFGGVPTVWLQARLVDGTPHVYDILASATYLTHFVVLPVVTGLVWFRYRDRFRAWIGAVLTLTVVGIGTYVVYPAAPPWLAARDGVVGPVRRISGQGWEALHLDGLDRLLGASQSASNPVAAMPSLHAAVPVLLVLFLWPVVGIGWRVALLGYAGLMAVVLVYTGEHYVVDVLAGWVVATLAALVAARVGRRSTPGASQRSDGQTHLRW